MMTSKLKGKTRAQITAEAERRRQEEARRRAEYRKNKGKISQELVDDVLKGGPGAAKRALEGGTDDNRSEAIRRLYPKVYAQVLAKHGNKQAINSKKQKGVRKKKKSKPPKRVYSARQVAQLRAGKVPT